MIRLSDWFQSNARRPLAIAAVLVLTFWCVVAGKSYLEIESNQRSGFSQLLNVTSLAMAQKNRALIESILHTAQTQTHAIDVAVCQGQKVLLSSKGNRKICEVDSGYFTRSLREPIPGFGDHTLAMTFSRADVAKNQMTLLLLGLGLIGITLFILGKVQRRFSLEVVGPLKEGILGHEPLQIAEFEELRRAYHVAQETKTSLAIAETLASVAQQVSHDIRSPLTAINMAVKGIDSLQEERKLTIERAARRINDIANDLLRKHKQTNPLQPIQPNGTHQIILAPTSLVAVVSQVVSEKRYSLERSSRVELRFDVIGPSDVACAVDQKELSRALSNLITNAVEAIDGSGTVTVAVRAAMKIVSIIVADSGKGMTEEVLSQLGNERVSCGKSESESGSGLGVLHAKTVVEAMNGKFSVQSKLGLGTIVTIQFPRLETEKANINVSI